MGTGSSDIAVIGFGEAASTFAMAGDWGRRLRVHDRLTASPETAGAKRDGYARAGVVGCDDLAEALKGAGLVLSLVTADQALAAARAAAPLMARGALFCDLNSVAPDTKRAAAEAIAVGGGDYVDVAVMSPVQPAALSAPLLVSGPRAEDAAEALRQCGFTKVRVVGDQIGRASAIKMIRSVLIKGVEALSAECMLAASEAGVLGEVVASLDASWPGADWAARADYNLDRMMVHGGRRAAEMQEVVSTLDGLGVGSSMSRGAVARQSAIGALGLTPPPAGLTAKIAALIERKEAVK